MRTSVELTYQGVDISREIAHKLLSFTWTDNESGKLDDIDLQMEDVGDLWSTSWFPSQGDTLQAWIRVDDRKIYCGTFSVDSIDFNGPPTTVSVKGASLKTDNALKKTRRTQAWEDVTIHDIAKRVAENNGMTLVFDADDDIKLDRKDQVRETDLGFLHRIATEAGYAVKVTDGQIAIFSQEKYDNQPSELTIRKNEVLTWQFGIESFTTYSRVVLNYYDPATKALTQSSFGSGAPVLTVTQRVGTLAEAQRMAKAALRRKNSEGFTGTLTMVGNVNLVAGITVNLEGFGNVDGKYLIESATHAISGGYTTSVTLRRSIRGY